MATVLPNVRDVRTVLVRQGAAWGHDVLAKAAERRKNELRFEFYAENDRIYVDDLAKAAERRSRNELRFEFMPRVTESTYRENAGRESLTVRPAEGTFEDVFGLLADHARTFIEFDTDEFVGLTSSGESKVPGPQTIIKTLKAESVSRGLVIGEQTVLDDDGERRNDVFRVTLRGLASEMRKLPKWYVDLAGQTADGGEEE